MRAISLFSYITFSCRSKSLYSILLSLDHFFIRVIFYTRNCFSSMNSIGINWMSIQIFNYFYRINSSFYFHLIWLHSLLNSSSYFRESGIYTSFSNSCVSCIFDRFQKPVIHGIKSNSKSGINNISFDVCSEINFTNIIISYYSIISRIWRIMSCNMI